MARRWRRSASWRDCAHLDPCALHLHLGTDIYDAGLYFAAAREVFAFARQLRAELGMQIRHVDLGGGFGVPTVRPLSSMELRYLDQGLPVRPPQPAALPRIEDYAAGIVKIARGACGAGGRASHRSSSSNPGAR